MKTATVWRAGSLTDPGLERRINEDRVFVDDARGIFMVVDGLGGHAAGETAAETAVKVIAQEFSAARAIDERQITRPSPPPTMKSRNLQRRTQRGAEWRVYSLWPWRPRYASSSVMWEIRGFIITGTANCKKSLCDHSPVGQLEDAGELTEEEAMHHPRRNEVFRDVGSYPSLSPDDPRFIEIKRFRFRPTRRCCYAAMV